MVKLKFGNKLNNIQVFFAKLNVKEPNAVERVYDIQPKRTG